VGCVTVSRCGSVAAHERGDDFAESVIIWSERAKPQGRFSRHRLVAQGEPVLSFLMVVATGSGQDRNRKGA
jgi:hypothetical protein